MNMIGRLNHVAIAISPAHELSVNVAAHVLDVGQADHAEAVLHR